MPFPAVPQLVYVCTGPLRIWLWAVDRHRSRHASRRGSIYRGLSRLAHDPGWGAVAGCRRRGGCLSDGGIASSRSSPQGDEPHYLVITQSLLIDHDLKIENNHRRGDYHAYYPVDLKPDYRRRGVDNEIYSIHAPGLAVIIAPAFALLGYPGVPVFLAVVSGLATAHGVDGGMARDFGRWGRLVWMGQRGSHRAILFSVLCGVPRRAWAPRW